MAAERSGPARVTPRQPAPGTRKKVVMGGFGFREILVVLLILVILFGAKRIP
jgi:hypothetical protein